MSVIALAERGALFDPGPCMYMEKLAGAFSCELLQKYGPANVLRLQAPTFSASKIVSLHCSGP